MFTPNASRAEVGDAATGTVDPPVEAPVGELSVEPFGELVDEVGVVVEGPVEVPVGAALVITLVDSDSVPLVGPTGAAAPPPPPPQAASAASVARDAHVREKRLLMESYLS